MKRTLFSVVVAIALILAASGCGIKDADRAAIEDFIRAHVQHAQSEDIEAYMNDLAKANPLRDTTRARAAEMFEQYDLTYELPEIKVLSVGDGTAKVETVQITRKKAGDRPFKDSEVKLVYTLVYEDGAWKILNSRVASMKRLN